MTQYQKRYKAAGALQMIPGSDCKVSDIDYDDDCVASPDVYSEIVTIHIVHPGQTEFIVAGKQEERRPREQRRKRKRTSR